MSNLLVVVTSAGAAVIFSAVFAAFVVTSDRLREAAAKDFELAGRFEDRDPEISDLLKESSVRSSIIVGARSRWPLLTLTEIASYLMAWNTMLQRLCLNCDWQGSWCA